MTIAQAKALRRGQGVCTEAFKTAKGLPQRWRVSGTPKTWKTDSGRVQVPLKYGLNRYGYLTERNLSIFYPC